MSYLIGCNNKDSMEYVDINNEIFLKSSQDIKEGKLFKINGDMYVLSIQSRGDYFCFKKCGGDKNCDLNMNTSYGTNEFENFKIQAAKNKDVLPIDDSLINSALEMVVNKNKEYEEYEEIDIQLLILAVEELNKKYYNDPTQIDEGTYSNFKKISKHLEGIIRFHTTYGSSDANGILKAKYFGEKYEDVYNIIRNMTQDKQNEINKQRESYKNSITRKFTKFLGLGGGYRKSRKQKSKKRSTRRVLRKNSNRKKSYSRKSYRR